MGRSMRGGVTQLVLPPILDACCGPRMMWFDKADRRALFIDKRAEVHEITDKLHPGRSPCVVAPDVVADFTAMPFDDESFYLVVFDPPHINATRSGKQGRFRKIYGVLPNDWQAMLRASGFRVVADVRGRSWSCPSRPRVDVYPQQDKLRWEAA